VEDVVALVQSVEGLLCVAIACLLYNHVSHSADCVDHAVPLKHFHQFIDAAYKRVSTETKCRKPSTTESNLLEAELQADELFVPALSRVG